MDGVHCSYHRFEEWKPTESENVTSYLEDVKVLTENLNQDNITKILEDTTFQNVVLPLWSELLYHLRNDNGELSAFWMSYIDLVEDVLLALL